MPPNGVTSGAFLGYLELLIRPWEVVVDQFVEWSLTIPEIHSSNPVMVKFYFLSTVLKIRRKENGTFN